MLSSPKIETDYDLYLGITLIFSQKAEKVDQENGNSSNEASKIT